MSADPDRTVTKADISAKLREIAGEVEETAVGAKDYALIAGAVAIVGVVVLAYILGRRKGRTRRTVVEVRRITV
jgi:hypothetical protein